MFVRSGRKSCVALAFFRALANFLAVCGFVVLSAFHVVEPFGQLVFAAESEEEHSAEIVVTANRDATPRSKVGGSLTVVSREEIERSRLTHVSEILRTVPGVDVVRTGGRGGNTSVFLRGANSEHTLVLLDGIEMNNPVNPTRAFNFSDLTLENVERIEIIRGPQSGLWGSDAIGGVINIITRTAATGSSVTASTEAGSFGRFVQKARAAYGMENAQLSLGFAREDEHGISAAESRDGNDEKDGFENSSFTLRARFEPTKYLKVDNTFRYNDSTSELDNVGGVGGDDPNRELDNEQIFWRSSIAGDFYNGSWVPTLGVSVAHHRLSDRSDVDELHPIDLLDSHYSGRMVTVDILNTFQLTDSVRTVFGLESQEERASSFYFSDGAFGPFTALFGPESIRNNAAFLDLTSDLTEKLSLSSALRVDDHDIFGSQTTYRLSPVYAFSETGTRLRGAVGTGFKAPSLNQLYSSFGNPELEPEESIGWEVGFDQTFFRGLINLGATYHRQDIDELVTFNSATFVLENINKAEIAGFDIFVELEPVEDTLLRVDYTYLDAEDRTLGNQLLRRARNRLQLSMSQSFCDDQGSLGVQVQYVGDRPDNDFSAFPAERVSLDGYTLVNLTGSYQVTQEVKFFARIDNLFDEEYQDVLGFGTYGVGAFGGVEVAL